MNGNPTRVTLIAALSRQRVIGNAGGLPWKLPNDLKLFKSMTVNKPIVMGRKTFESIGRPLPKRRNIVLSRSAFAAPGVEVFSNIASVLETIDAEQEVMVIGGEQIYRLCLPRAQKLYLSIVEGVFIGDAYFPTLQSNDWSVTASKRYDPDLQNPHAFTFMELIRTPKPFARAIGIFAHYPKI